MTNVRVLPDARSYGVRPDCVGASGAPTAADDSSAGWERGSRWMWNTRIWLCVSNAKGAAVWQEVTNDPALPPRLAALEAAVADLTARVAVLEGQIKLKKDK